MKNIFFTFLFMVGTYQAIATSKAQVPTEDDLVACQDQADNFGNGKGDDVISEKCIETFKKLAPIKATATITRVQKLVKTKINFFGFRNMVLIEKHTGSLEVPVVSTEIIAGSSTELNTIEAMAIDEKNQEIIILEKSGNVLFFSSIIAGNIAPYRMLVNKELVGASELVIDAERNQVVVNNPKTKKILFFSRLANINANKGKQKLETVKVIDTSMMNFQNLSIDSEKSLIKGVDATQKNTIIFDLKLKL